MTEINQIKEKVSRILNFDTNSHPALSQTTMTFTEHSQLIWEVLEEDFPSLITTIESQNSQIESLKAITELAVKGLKEVSHDIHIGSTCAKIAKSTLSEIERLQNAQT
jgi:hypothetical protein